MMYRLNSNENMLVKTKTAKTYFEKDDKDCRLNSLDDDDDHAHVPQ